MRNGRAGLIIATWMIVSARPCVAEEFEFLRASTAGAEVWIPTGAELKAKMGKLAVSERNKKGDTGSVLLNYNLPYFRKGVIRLDVDQVVAGTYTLQVLALQQGGHVGTVDLVVGEKKEGLTEFWMEDHELPKGTDEILVKFWVGGAEGARLKLNELSYGVQMAEGDYLLDDPLTNAASWKTEDLVVASATNGTRVRLAPGKRGGAMLYSPRLDRKDLGAVLLDVPALSGGYLTAQIVAFDHVGAYISSVDILRNAGAGKHVVPLQRVVWPEGAEKYMVKLWLSGQPTAEAHLARILVTREQVTAAVQ